MAGTDEHGVFCGFYCTITHLHPPSGSEAPAAVS